MRFELNEQIAHPCKFYNEDLFDHNEQAAWIFDGASGIGPKTIADAPTDPYWLVHTLNKEIGRAWNGTAATPAILKQAAKAMIARYEIAVAGNPPPMIDRPTACLMMARLDDRTMTISSVGDCWIVYRTNGKLGDFGVTHMEAAQPVYDERARLIAAGTPQPEMEKALLPKERDFRAKANIDGGYAIVDTSTRWIERLHTRSVEVNAGDKVLLMTDGFYRLIDTIQDYTPETLLHAAEMRGLESLYTELRSKENADEACTLYTRTKVRDDVAAALLTVTP